jgi:hypothetical protein
MNVNGVQYSKFRQYCYFVDGLHSKYASITNFLEQDFQVHDDHHNTIPISLELNNLTVTITSLAAIHVFSIRNKSGQIQQQMQIHDDKIEHKG